MAVFLAVGVGVMGVAGTMLSNKEGDKDLLASARAEGQENAGINFGADRHAAHLSKAMFEAQSAGLQSNIEIDKAQARAESDAKVSAAQAGVSGQSVDLVINDTERSKEEAKQSVDRQVRAQSLQLSTDYVDNYLNATLKKGTSEFKSKSSSTRFAEAGLSFGKGFVGTY